MKDVAEGGGRRPWWVAALAALVAAVLFTAAAYGTLERADGPGTRAVGTVLVVVSALMLVLALLLLVQDRVLRWWTEEIRTAQGLALVDSTPPGVVMDRLLHRVYGDHAENDHIARAVIGGAGYGPGTADLSVASAATVHIELRSEMPGTYSMTQTVEYTFDTPIQDHSLVLFATCDGRLRDQLVRRCRRPLFEWTYVPDVHLFRSSDVTIVDTLEVGLRYVDADGEERETDVVRVKPTPLNSDRWHEYVDLSGDQHGESEVPYVGTLKVAEVLLADLADGDHPLESVVGLTLRSISFQPDSHVAYWQPPFPSRVGDLNFDVTGLSDDHDHRELEFQLIPFLPAHTFVVSDTFMSAEEMRTRRVDSWVLPGHGVALIWRPIQALLSGWKCTSSVGFKAVSEAVSAPPRDGRDGLPESSVGRAQVYLHSLVQYCTHSVR